MCICFLIPCSILLSFRFEPYISIEEFPFSSISNHTILGSLNLSRYDCHSFRGINRWLPWRFKIAGLLSKGPSWQRAAWASTGRAPQSVASRCSLNASACHTKSRSSDRCGFGHWHTFFGISGRPVCRERHPPHYRPDAEQQMRVCVHRSHSDHSAPVGDKRSLIDIPRLKEHSFFNKTWDAVTTVVGAVEACSGNFDVALQVSSLFKNSRDIYMAPL